jgi:DNA-binding response OmpR family regulator
MRILVVEDDPILLDSVAQSLREAGYAVDEANNGSDGFFKANTWDYDAILLDWMLPEMTGLEVCKKIRETNSKTPIIFLTAKDTVQETVEGLKTGANDYIKKPFSFDELVERIKVQLRDKTEQEILMLGPIEINLQKHAVTVNKCHVSLTQKEFDLLTYLVKNKGSVCSRTQIIHDVWDIHFDYDTGVIDVFMNAIRKKLNLKVDEDYIKTIRGVGYIAND